MKPRWEKSKQTRGKKKLRVLMKIGDVPSQKSKTSLGFGFKVLKFKNAYL